MPTGDIPPVPDPDDLATVRDFNFALKIACDELHDDPFNPVARAELVRMTPMRPHRRRRAASRGDVDVDDRSA